MRPTVLIRGGGDLASGVAVRLRRAGMRVLVCELAEPLAVRRSVSFAEAIYRGSITVEGCTGVAADILSAGKIMDEGRIPVLVDPDGESVRLLGPDAVVDARMTKQGQGCLPAPVKLLIGLGPGFVAGENCDAVVETKRGFSLGRVLWSGPPEPDTSAPEAVAGQGSARVLRAPADGIVIAHADIGDRLDAGGWIAEVGRRPVTAPFEGVLRGLIHPGIAVKAGLKIGDLDPRCDPRLCARVSDKALAVAGGVLEALCSIFL